MKRLFIDIETSPNIVYSWRVGYKVSLDYENILEERKIIMVGWKWEGQPTGLLVWDKDQNDKAVVAKARDLILEADEVVAHNGDKFDTPWLRTRAIYHGLAFPHAVPSVDTCRLARAYGYFNSNRLDYLAKFLGLGKKLDAPFSLWKEVLEGSKEALNKMGLYCMKDVDLLEKVYHKLQGYIPGSVHAGKASGLGRWRCPSCGCGVIKVHKKRATKAGMVRYQLHCGACGSYYTVTEAVAKQGGLL